MAKPKMDFSTFKINTNISGSYNVINDNEKKEGGNRQKRQVYGSLLFSVCVAPYSACM